MIPMGLVMAEPLAIDVAFETTPETAASAGHAQPSMAAVECFTHGIAHVIDELGRADGVRWAAQAILAVAEADEERAG